MGAQPNMPATAQGASGPSSAMPPQAGGGPTSPAWWWAKKASTPISFCWGKRIHCQYPSHRFLCHTHDSAHGTPLVSPCYAARLSKRSPCHRLFLTMLNPGGLCCCLCTGSSPTNSTAIITGACGSGPCHAPSPDALPRISGRCRRPPRRRGWQLRSCTGHTACKFERLHHARSQGAATLKQREAPVVYSSLKPVAAPRAQGTDKSGGRTARASRRATAQALAGRLRTLSAAPPSVPASQDACRGVHSPGKTLCLGGFWLFTRGQ
jgi:hypothetical protein